MILIHVFRKNFCYKHMNFYEQIIETIYSNIQENGKIEILKF